MTKTKAHEDVEVQLPTELRPQFNELARDYKEAAEEHTGQVWVNYKILANLIRAGWRKPS
jgi:hypothetical protein